MINEADRFLLGLKNRAEEIILANIDSEINYIFTNDEYYLDNRTKLIPSVDRPAKGGKKGGRDDGTPLVDAQNTKEKEKDKGENISAGTDTKDNRDKLKKEAEKMFVRELRLRVDEYYRIVVRTLRVITNLFRKSFLRTSASSLFVNLRKRCSIPSTMSFSRTRPLLKVFQSLQR